MLLVRKIRVILAVALVLCTLFIISTPSFSADAIFRSYVSASGDYERTYTIHDDYGHTTTYSISIPEETYQHYGGLSHGCYTYDDLKKFVTPEMFEGLVPSLSETCTTDCSFIKAVLEIVQQIPYEEHETELYPVETMVENAGDCSDKSYIAASFLVEKGYYTILLRFELDDVGHMGIGVAASVFEADYTAVYWQYNGRKYYYCECTNLGWKIGELPSDLEDEEAYIIDVGGHKQAQITTTSQPDANGQGTDIENVLWQNIRYIMIIFVIASVIIISYVARKKETLPPFPPTTVPPTLFCPNCGTPVTPNAKYCPSCGKKIK